MKIVNYIALTLVIIGGLNWGLVGAANFDLVAAIFGAATFGARLVYVLVGISAIYSILFYRPIATTPNHFGINRGA